MKRLGALCVLILSLAVLGHTLGQERFRLSTPLGLDEYFYVPEDNPLTPEKIELGRRLFFDKLLSQDRSISCASCHKPELAFSDGLAVSVASAGAKTLAVRLRSSTALTADHSSGTGGLRHSKNKCCSQFRTQRR